jgi:HSP20 family molecular chaperone IbpA
MALQPTTPPVNVYEGNGQISVAMPLPGAHPEHVEVVVSPTKVLVKAECKYQQDAQHYLRHDWRVGSVHADIDLPQRVDPASGRATLNLGVLVVMAQLSETGAGQYGPKVE